MKNPIATAFTPIAFIVANPRLWVLIRVVSAIVACTVYMVMAGCKYSASSDPEKLSGFFKSSFEGAQSDTKAIGKSLGASASAITAEAQGVRTDTANAPAPIREAAAKRADAIVAEAASVKAQAGAVDPGITRKLEELSSMVATVTANLTEANARADKAERERDDARSLSRWSGWLFLGMVLGMALFGLKMWPPTKDFPGEVGVCIAAGCLIGLAWIFVTSWFPVWTAIASAIALGSLALIVIGAIGVTVWRLNKIQSTIKRDEPK